MPDLVHSRQIDDARPGAWSARAARIGLIFAILCLTWIARVPDAVRAQENAVPPHWIWHPSGSNGGGYPVETRYFRKGFAVKEPSRLTIDIAADNAYTLFLDGKELARGDTWQHAQAVDLKITNGAHMLAVVASNAEPGAAGLLIRGGVLPLGQSAAVHTDASWRSSASVPVGDAWKRVGFDDSNWAHARDLGVLGSGPWTNIVFDSGTASDRFKVPPEFKVETAATPAVTGSIVSFSFDADGHPCVGIEGGPIARLDDTDRDGRYDERVAITPQMNNCQGFSFIKGVLYAVGNGPRGAGLYRLTDKDRDGVFETTETIRLTDGGMGEHGPHSVQLGPDGKLYYNNGNHAHLKPPIDPSSPCNVAYEGELLPHYNDARGHAAGIMAPGGEIYRSDDEGKSWKRIVAGFRNEYDFAFHSTGELFSFDSDMEWDLGMPWYRPVRVVFCPIGAEFGWRNGSGKWPTYYFDSLPAVYNVGRGSPTGVTFYQDDRFPAEYRDNFFICDWSQGRILAIALQPSGAGYAGSAREFVTGQTLNCTDIEVGPDGELYFSTGGRGTQGGLFRVSPKHAVTTTAVAATDVFAVAAHSPRSSYTQRRLRDLKSKLGSTWDAALAEAVAHGDSARRLRALDLMMQFGPPPTVELLVRLAGHADADVRARAVALLAFHHTPVAYETLTAALRDSDPRVRRHACEAWMEQPAASIPPAALIPMLADADRNLRFAARVAIEHSDLTTPAARAALLEIAAPRGRIAGLLALARAGRLDQSLQNTLFDHELALAKLDLPEADQIDLLRLIEVTYLLGPSKADAQVSPAFRAVFLQKYPAASVPLSRELARLLAYLDEPAALAKILKHQAETSDTAAQIFDAYCLRVFRSGWTPATKRAEWEWFQKASRWDGGFSFLGYLDFMIQSLLPTYNDAERATLVKEGAAMPFPTRVLVRSIDLNADPSRIPAFTTLYDNLVAADPNASGPNGELRAMIVEQLGRSGRPEARAALRSIARIDPSRRDALARAFADHPTDDDVPVLIDALGSPDLNTARAAAAGLSKLKFKADGPEALRKLTLLARRADRRLMPALAELAHRWTGIDVPFDPRNPSKTSAFLVDLYKARYPSGPALDQAGVAAGVKYTLDDLVRTVLDSEPMRQASAGRGRVVLTKAKCLDCHKFGSEGAGLGPDLTTVSSRFGPKEILESIVLPSKVVSDQYKMLAVATDDGKVYNGMPVVNDDKNLVLLISDGTKVTLPKARIEEQKESKTSVMPEGLLNMLSRQDIADLIALFNAQPRVAAPAAGTPK